MSYLIDYFHVYVSGEKLKPVIIGKFAKPRAFKRISSENLPVMYRNNKTAWMNGQLFEEWILKFDRDMRRSKRNIILFLDNAPCHPKLQHKLKNIKLAFFPPNTTSLSQPMDAGIIQTVKLKYRRRQLKYVLNKMSLFPSALCSQMLKSISILDTIYWVNAAWEDVEEATIRKCFAKCGFSTPAETPAETPADSVPLAMEQLAFELFGVDFEELPNIDVNLAICDREKDWDKPSIIIDSLKSVQEEEEEEEEEIYGPSVISVGKVHDYLSQLKAYAVHNGHSSLLDKIMSISDEIVDIKFSTCTKQASITDFFTHN